jgi:hypothetical protein
MTDRHDIAEILLKVALNTITPITFPLFIVSGRYKSVLKEKCPN